MSVILTVASFKGGVGKTTTAVHLAAHFSTKARTILVDGDPNGSSARWAAAGKLPFEVVGLHQGQKAARRCEHLVIDTGARPNAEEMRALADGCDMLVLPTTPDALSLDALMQTITVLNGIGSNRFRILLTIVPPKPVPEGDIARRALLAAGLPVFEAEIRRTIVFPRAASEGVTVDRVSGDMAGLGWRDYEAVGEEIEAIHGETTVEGI